MSQSIDIYSAPASDGFLPSVNAHRRAIMQAALNGAPVQRLHGESGDWQHCDNLDWNWRAYDYRIDPASKHSVPRPFAAGDYVVSTYAPLTGITPGAVYQVAEVLVNKPWSKRLRMSNSALVICVGYFRHATDAEITAYLASKTPAFRIGDWVMMDDGVVAQIVALGGHSDISCPIVSLRGIVNWHPVATLRHATAAEIASLDPLADGHNPSNLKVSQVGEGWRLMDRDEIEARNTLAKTVNPTQVSNLLSTTHIQIMREDWLPDAVYGHCVSNAYRTKLSRAELAALSAPAPKVKVKRALTPNDLPAVFWVHTVDGDHLITHISNQGIGGPSFSKASFDFLMHVGYQHSTNRRDWSPFYIEV